MNRSTRNVTCWRAAVIVTFLFLGSRGGSAAVDPSELARWIDEIVERPTELIDGVGHAHQEVTTDVPEAQAFYDQGLAWTHSYVWIEAARSFRQALALDPNLALAYLGLSTAYRNMEMWDRAKEYLDRAVALKPKVSDRERLYIDARVRQWEALTAPTEERRAKRDAYRAALARILARYPDDAEIWVARGQAAEAFAWGRGQLGGIDSIAWYTTALTVDPNHVGAQHYLLHAYENLFQYEKAVLYAEQLGENARVAPHAQHMVAHVLPRVGRWDEAVSRFAEADRLERAYYAREGIPPWVDWHHLHNLHLYGMALLRQGQVEKAGEILKEAFETPGQHAVPEVFSHVPYIEYLLHVGRFEDALTAARQLAATQGLTGSVVGRALQGEALLLLNRVEEARALVDGLDADLERLSRELTGSNAAYARRRARSFVNQFKGTLALYADDPFVQWTGQETFLSVADGLLGQSGFDGWGEGLFRLERMMRFANMKGLSDLVEELRNRMRRLDPDYTPRLEFP